jgi:hypothetical protein
MTKELEAAVKDIEESSDRSVGILAATLVDEHLLEALKKTLRQNTKIQTETFRMSGPLGSNSLTIGTAQQSPLDQMRQPGIPKLDDHRQPAGSNA